MTVAVLTLVRDRHPQLANLVRGLACSTRAPDTLVVAWMGGADPTPALGEAPCPVQVLPVLGRDGRLPLATARNATARAAAADVLVFLDVDCIPGAGLVGAYERGLAEVDGLLMGRVRYLPAGAADGPWEEAALAAAGVEHPARPAPPGGAVAPAAAPGLFWSLSFAARRTTFLARIGGFDAGYVGYGGEDTDLAYAARSARVPLAWATSAVAYHQDHEHYDPPLQHLEDIVANARRFRRKWGAWPMVGWLRAFAVSGHVAWSGDDLVVRRLPTRQELAAARTRAFPGSPVNV
jgi:hypothetical protein